MEIDRGCSWTLVLNIQDGYGWVWQSILEYRFYQLGAHLSLRNHSPLINRESGQKRRLMTLAKNPIELYPPPQPQRNTIPHSIINCLLVR